MDGLEQDRHLLMALSQFSGFPPSRMAVEAGLAATTILRPINGTTTSRLSAPTLEKLQQRYPDFAGWSEFLGRGAIVPADPDMVEVDQIDLRYGLGATYVDVPVEAQKRVFSRSWLRNFTTSPPEHLFWTAGEGDSMDPTIRSGEVVLIDTAQSIPRMSGGIWALTIGEMGMIKRLHVPGRNRIQLLSDNGKEPPYDPVDDDEMKIIGRVVAVVRKL